MSPSRICQSALLLCLVHCAATESVAEEQLCRTIGKPPFLAEFIGVATDGKLRFRSAGEAVAVTHTELVTWGAVRDTADNTHVLLSDGSLLVASDVALNGDELVIQSHLFGEPEGFAIAGTSRVPVSAVRAIVFRVPLPAADRDALFTRLRSATGFSDQLWLANGDQLQGSLSKLQREKKDDKPGPLILTLQANGSEVEIRPEGEQGKLLEKVQAIVFNPSLVRVSDTGIPHTVVGLSDGSRLFAKRMQADGGRANFTLLSGATIASHADENIWRHVVSLQSFGPHVRYLSDHPEPFRFVHTPLVGRKWPLAKDMSVAGGHLRTGGQLFLKGLGMHSKAQAFYALDRPYARFEAELAIDETAAGGGSVVFLIAHDASGKSQFAGKPIVVRGGDPPVPVSIDITGARRLALVVLEAERGDVLDRANWLNARLIPAPNAE